jgi:hypothetical protein
MKNVIAAFAALALIGSVSGALAQADSTAPNGGGQDTSKSNAVPEASTHKMRHRSHHHHSAMHKRHNSAMKIAPNGGGEDTSKSNAVPDASKPQ